MPVAGKHDTFDEWIDSIRHPGQKGFWANARAYAVNLLKAYWATRPPRRTTTGSAGCPG